MGVDTKVATCHFVKLSQSVVSEMQFSVVVLVAHFNISYFWGDFVFIIFIMFICINCVDVAYYCVI